MSYPSRYIVFDTETLPQPSDRKGWDQDHHLRMGVAAVYDPQVTGSSDPLYHGFRTSAEFRLLIDNMPYMKEPVYVFAHNIGFDLRIVEWFRWFAEGSYSLTPPKGTPNEKRWADPLFVVDGSPVLIRSFRADGQRFMLYDTFNWWNVKLEKIGEWMGFAKGKMPAWGDSDEEWFTYCRRDVDLLDNALRRLWAWLGCIRVSDWMPTPAAQSMFLFHTRFEKKRIKRPEDFGCLKLDRHAYYGGRVECYKVGYIEGPIYQIDINGLYPRVMLDGLYPTEIKDYDHDCKVRDALPDVGDGWATVEVFVDSPETPYPVRGLDGVVWCRGRVRTVLAGPEYQRAQAQGHIAHVGRWTHHAVASLFDGWVRWLWKHRVDAESRSDRLIAATVKRLLNCLHGKFGQRDGSWQYVGAVDTPGDYLSGKSIAPRKEDDVDIRVLDGHRFFRRHDQEHKNAFVPISAYVAAYARIFMDDMISFIGPEHVYYLSTDSLLVDQAGYDTATEAGLIDPHKLGFFKLEETYRWVDIQGPNQMDHDKGWKHSGLKSIARPTEPGHWSVDDFSDFADDVFQGRVSSVSTRTRCVHISKPPLRRLALPSGLTEPFWIDNWACSPEKQLTVPVRRGGHGGK